MLAEDHRALRKDGAVYHAIDADSPFEGQDPFELEPPRQKGERLLPGHDEFLVLAGRSEHAVQRPGSDATHACDTGQFLLLGGLARPVQGPDRSPPFRIAHPVQAHPFLD